MIKASHLRLWLALIFLPARLFALDAANPEWFTRVWQIDDGLLDNNVNGIVQGPDGYLWIVTPVGLMQFDGASFNAFPLEPFTGPRASHVRTLVCGRTGVLWMGADGGGVLGLNSNLQKVPFPQKGLPAHVPLGIAEDRDGSIWLGYGNSVCRVREGQITESGEKSGVPAGYFHSLKNDGAGNVWLSKGTQIGLLREGGFEQIPGLEGLQVQSLAATPADAIWFAAEGHLFRCDTRGALRDWGAFQNAAGPTVIAMLEDHTGAVWICTEGNGLFRHSLSGFERIETSHSALLSIAEDREGNIWAGTGGGGLNRISASGIRREEVGNDQITFEIQSICQDSMGVFWGATRNGFLVSRMAQQWKPVHTNASFAGAVTCVAAGTNGVVWIGTRNRQLFSLHQGSYTLCATNVADGPVHALLPVANGDLWVMGDDTVYRARAGRFQNMKLPRQVRKLYAIGEGADGGIWIGANGILLRFDGGKFVNETPRQWISDRPICCLYGTPDGCMWIGSRGGGLVRFKDGKASRIGMEQGLCNNYISQMVADDFGWMWFGSNHGIFKIRRSELDRALEDRNAVVRPVVYGRNEGLISQEAVFSSAPPFILPRAFRDRDSCVWMVMHAGLVVTDPRVLSEDPATPPVLLTQVVMDGQTIASGATPVQSVTNLKTLNGPLLLPPSHRHLQFGFTAFHFSAPENLHFRYQLAGFDTDWIDAGTARAAEYSRLNAGDYQFHVEASVGDGPWNPAPFTLALTVAPFFWQTLSFRAGMLVLFILTLIAVVRYISFRRLRMELRDAEKRAAVERERGRIARDIHDDLGNRLTEIQLLAGLAQRHRAAPVKTAAQVDEISSAARQATDALDEIVWAINPTNDTLPHLINYIGQFTSDFMRTAGIRCHLDLPENPPAKSVSAEVRHNLFLAVKEALSNIVRHSGATEVSLLILATDESLSVLIRDNGRGFNGEVKASGADGLENMRRRIAEIGGQFQIQSRPGDGVRVSFNGLWLAGR